MKVLTFSSLDGVVIGDTEELSRIDDDETNLLFLFEAILKVKIDYVIMTGKSISRLEKIFAYELYHQWSKIIERNYEEDNNGNRKYILNAESGKNMHLFDGRKRQMKYPDMVLHKYMDYPDDQGVVCEIKRKENCGEKEFEEDIKKLERFVCGRKNRYKFRFGVFILFNDTIDSIFENMNKLNWLSNCRKTRSERIVLVTYKNNRLEVTTLYDALNKRERNEYLKKYETQ